jgi:hypothetical protein
MEVSASPSHSTDSAEVIEDGRRISFAHRSPSPSSNSLVRDDNNAEWILNLPFLSSISEFIISHSVLDSNSSVQVKARFVEVVYFAFFVLCILFSAAVPHVNS